MRKNNYTLFRNYSRLFILLIVPALTGCFSVKTSSSKSNPAVYQTFYVGDAGMQYFIKPLTFEEENGHNERLHVDFTFRYKTEIKDSATINFSIESSAILKSANRIVIKGVDYETVSSKAVLVFNEKRKDIFVSRFTAKVNLKELALTLNSTDPTKILATADTGHIYLPTKKTKRHLLYLKDNVFVLF